MSKSINELVREIYKSPILLLFGLTLLIFSSYNFYERSRLDINGEILSKENSHYKNHPNRPYTLYKLQDPSTKREFNYKADANDPSLSRDLAVGSIVVKRKGDLEYLVNKKKIEDFPLFFYSTLVFIGLCLIVFGARNALILIKNWLTNGST